MAAPEAVSARPSTVCFSGRTYPQLAWIVRELCAVAGRWCLPLLLLLLSPLLSAPLGTPLPG
jgi:hypothetical protein